MRRILPLFTVIVLLPAALGAEAPAPEDPQAGQKRLLDAALRITRAEANPRTQGMATVTVVGAYADAGLYEQAFAATELIDVKSLKSTALVDIAERSAKRGDDSKAAEMLAAAHRTASDLGSEESRAFVWQRIADACSAMKDTDAALPMMRQILSDAQALQSSAVRDVMLDGLSRAAAQAGFAEIAEQAWQSMSDPASKAQTLVALALLRRGSDPAGGSAALLDEALTQAVAVEQPADRGRTLAAIADACAQLGLKERAAKALAEASGIAAKTPEMTAADELWQAIVYAYASCGLPDDAFAACENIRLPSSKRKTVEGLVKRHVSAGDYDDAEEAARTLPSKHGMLKALLSVADAWAREGEYEHALDIVEGLEDPIMRDSGLRSVATICGEHGDFTRAVKLAATIQSRGLQEGALMGAATGFLRTDEKEALVARAREIEEATADITSAQSRLLLAANLAGAYSQGGAGEDAFRLARKVSEIARSDIDSFTKAYGLAIAGTTWAGLGDKEAARTHFNDAVTTAEGIAKWEYRQGVLKEILKEMVKADVLDRAVDAAEDITGKGHVVTWMVTIIERHLQSGRPAEARQVFETLCERLEQVPAVDYRVELLARVGAAYGRLGLDLGKTEQKALNKLLADLNVKDLKMPQANSTGGRQIRLIYFYKEGCGGCVEFKPLMEELEKEYPDLELRYISLVPKEAVALEIALGKRAKIYIRPIGRVPAVFSLNDGLLYEDISKENLINLAESARGLAAPWSLSIANADAPEKDETIPGADSTGGKQLKLVYFYTDGCAGCAQVKLLLPKLKMKYPDAEIRDMNIVSREAMALNAELCERAKIGKQYQGLVPAIFSLNDGLVGDEITKQSLTSLAESARGFPAPWTLDIAGSKGLKYEDLTAVMVVSGGLVDSVNPCAFAVIIFLITYLAYLQKSRVEIALAGALFTAAVFLVYLAIGMGLYSVLGLSEGLSLLLKRTLFIVMALLLVVAATMSIIDGVRCLQGRPGDMKLKLPEGIRKRVKLLITRRARLGLTVGATLILGGLVALLEFPCTGQVYVPIVIALRELSPERWGAFGWLVLYNLCFILPLLAIFVIVYLGGSSEKIIALFQRHMATVKFAMATVFAGLFVVVLVLMP